MTTSLSTTTVVSDFPPPTRSVQQFLNDAAFGRRRAAIVILGFIVMTLEGIEIGVWGFVYPQITGQWGTSLSAITAIVTIGVIGLSVGSVIAGPLADRVGRKIIVVVGTTGFGLSTLGGALAANELALGSFRLAACLFLGAVMPLTITLVAEFMPERRRTALVGVVFTGFPLGTVLTGVLATTIVPTLGWRWLLVTGFLMALLLVPFLMVALPESTIFLVRKGGASARIRSILGRISPRADVDSVDLTPPPGPAGVKHKGAVAVVLSRRYVITSLLVWSLYFIAAAVVYIFLNYLPLIVSQFGIDAAGTGRVVAVFGVGGVIGALVTGFAMGRFGQYRVLALAFGLAAIAAWTIAAAPLTALLLSILAFLIGVVLVGANSGMNALSASVFPTEARATGVSWMHSFGKAGSIVSGLLGGIMISAGWGISGIFLVLGFPLLLGACVIVALWLNTRRSTTQ